MLSGWWLSHQPLWKMMEWKSVGIMKFPTVSGKKTIPNHQAVITWPDFAKRKLLDWFRLKRHGISKVSLQKGRHFKQCSTPSLWMRPTLSIYEWRIIAKCHKQNWVVTIGCKTVTKAKFKLPFYLSIHVIQHPYYPIRNSNIMLYPYIPAMWYPYMSKNALLDIAGSYPYLWSS